LSGLTFTNHDDMFMDRIASDIHNGGLSRYWANASGLAHGQGRGYFYFSVFFFVLPFFTEHEVVRALMASAAQLLSLGVIGVFLSLYFRPALGLVFVSLAYAFLPEWPAHFPVSAYPVVYHMAYLMFFGGISLYICAVRCPYFRQRRRTWLSLAAISLFLSYSIYEAVWALFLFTSFTVVWLESRRTSAEIPQASGLKRVGSAATSLPLVAFWANAVVYLAFRWAYPTKYAGSAMSGQSVKNLPGIWRVLRFMAFGSFPGVSYLLQGNLVRAYAGGSIREGGVARYFWANLGGAELLWVALLAALIPIFMQVCWRGLAGPCSGSWRRGLWLTGVSGLMAVMIPLPVAMTVKYQSDPLYSPYIAGYYSFVAWCVAITAAVVAFCGISAAWSRKVKTVVQVVLTGVVVLIASLNAVADDAVISEQARAGLKWHLMNIFMRNEAFRKIPDRAVVLAPSLWGDIDPNFSHYKQYWTEYVHGHSGRNVSFVRSLNGEGSTSLFYLDVEPLLGTRSGVVLLSLLNPLLGGGTVFVTNDVTVICEWPYPRASLSVVTLPRDSVAGSAFSDSLRGDWEQPTAAFQCTEGLCSAVFHQPRMIPGTARLVYGSGFGHNVSAAVGLEFGKGFSVPEQAGDRYWRWSDGSDGTGALSVRNDLGSPVAVRLHATVITGSAAKTRLDVTIGGDGPKTLYVASGDLLDERFVAEPGSTRIEIHSYGPRIGSGEDSRYRVFGLEKWSLSVRPKVDIGGEALQQVEEPVQVTFDRGFFQTERQNGDYWRWSTESSGVMSLWNRTSKAMEVMFSSELFTTYGQKYPVEVVFPGGRVTLQVNGDRVLLTRLIQLPPGRSEIIVKSWAPPLPRKGDDPRTFAFGVGRWKLYIPFVEVPQ